MPGRVGAAASWRARWRQDFPPSAFSCTATTKTPQELREAIGAGVGRIIIDSRIELGRISQIAGELGVEQAIYMRITPGVNTRSSVRTGCEDSKFGFTMRDDFAYRCVQDVLAAPNVRLAGLHCTSARRYSRSIRIRRPSR